MKNCLIIVILLSWWNVFLADYVIQRRDVKPNNGNYRPDTFKISHCSGEVSAQCAAMNGTKQKNTQCQCVCNKKNDGVLYKSTFGFYDNIWKCESNTKVRNNGECSILFVDESFDSPITTIVSGKKYSFQDWYPSCSIAGGSYASCSGKWEVLNQQSISSFTLEKDSSSWWYNMYNIYYTDNPEPNLSGRLVRINITCTSSQQQAPADCVLFKIQGKLSCPYPLSTSSLVMTSTIGSSLQPSSTLSGSPTPEAKVSTSIKHQIQPSNTSSLVMASTIGSSLQPPSPLSASPTPVAKVLTSINHQIQLTTSTMPIPLSIPTPTSLTLLSPSSTLGLRHTRQTLNPPEESTEQSEVKPTLKTSSEKRKKSARSEDKTGLIIGAVAGVIGLGVLIIVIVIMKRRKNRDVDFKNRMVVENAGYGRGQDSSIRFDHSGQQSPDEDEYSYAYNNAAQFAQIHKQGRECPTNNYHEPGSSVANQVYGQTDELNQMACEAPAYNTLEQPVYAKVDKSKKKCPSNSADAPIYNTLEEPEYAKVDKSLKTKLSAENQEPVYNVLEGPETDEGLCDEPPTYQVLEGPFSEGPPVYDVLEGPESDEAPVYGALEEQDPHVYGALDMPDNQGSYEENRGYDDMVYDSVGDVINDQGDIYQELNQGGQRNSDVYQALNYPGNTMHLNELDKTHSNA